MATATAQSIRSHTAHVSEQARPFARDLRIEGSRIAGVASKSLSNAMAEARGNWKTLALMAGGMALSFFGGLGIGGSWTIERYKNRMVAADSKEVLAEYYRTQIATQLGINPKRVGVNELEMAAHSNKTIAQAIAKVSVDQNNANRANNFISGGAMALGGWMPGLSGISHIVAHGATAVTGIAVASAFNKDVLHTQDVMEHLDAKKTSGAPITAGDIVTLRISQDEQMQTALKKQNGVAFHKMSPEQQRAVLIGMPDMRDAEQIAANVNEGRIDVQDVLMMKQQKPNWMQKVGGSRAGSQSFVEQHHARQSQAQLMANTVN